MTKRRARLFPKQKPVTQNPDEFDHQAWLIELFERKGMLPVMRLLYRGDHSQVELTQTAELLGVSTGATVRAIRTGRTHGVLQVVKLPVAGHKYRISLTDLGRLLMERPVSQWGDGEVREAVRQYALRAAKGSSGTPTLPPDQVPR